MRPSIVERASASDRVIGAALMSGMDRYPFFSVADSPSAPRTVFNGHEMINLGSNNYLGLADDPEMIDAAIDAVHRFGTGTTGSRLMNGSTSLHDELEALLCEFTGKEAALVCSTGYGANLAALSGLLTPEDTALVDAEIHASLQDGVTLGGADIKRFRHNTVKHVSRLLADIPGPAACVIDGVYSMRGDMAPLKDLAALCTEQDVLLIDDEAHGLGVLGDTGIGAAEASGTLPSVDVISYTFSKSLASCGGAIVGSKAAIDAIKLTSNPFLFTAANTPGSVATAVCGLKMLTRNPQWPAEVLANASYLQQRLESIGIPVTSSDSAIITIEVGSDPATLHAWRLLWNRGVFCNPVVAPGVKPGHALLRLSVMRTHTHTDFDDAVHAFESIREVFP